jgi:hypothetical protein
MSDAPYEVYDYECDGEFIELFVPSYFSPPEVIELTGENGQQMRFELRRQEESRTG